jgi:hypothetical protein
MKWLIFQAGRKSIPNFLLIRNSIVRMGMTVSVRLGYSAELICLRYPISLPYDFQKSYPEGLAHIP